MISALVGSVIMSAVTVAMLLAINISNKILSRVGTYPLTNQEKKIILRNGRFNSADIETINQEIKLLKFNE
tara:strand:- start:10066 stop:10278 length:213 start_codon:yes stop_codon:yes gene_type:complete